MNNRGLFTIDAGFLLKVAIILLAVVQILSYYGAEWEITTSEWSTQVRATQLARNSMTFITMRFAALGIVLLVFLLSIRVTVRDCIAIFLLMMICVLHTVVLVADLGVVDSLYESSMPLMYLLVFGFWIGQNRKLWSAVESLVPTLLLLYISAFLICFLSFFLEHGWAIFSNSSLMAFYSHAFSIALPYSYIRFRRNKAGGMVTYFLLIFLVVGAVIIRSRAWLIQSAVFALVVGFTTARINGKNIGKLFHFVLLATLVVAGAVLLLGNYLNEFWESLVEKGTVDSRSEQYLEMLEQTEWYGWIFGKGAIATYVSKMYGEYQFIDNEFFYLSFHYGVPFAILYFLPFIRTFFVCMRLRKKEKLALFAAYCILVWVVSVNGLSVFHRIIFDVKSFIIPTFIGYVYSDIKAQRKELNGS